MNKEKTKQKVKLKSKLKHQMLYLITPEIRSEGLRLLLIHSLKLEIDEKDFIVQVLRLKQINKSQKVYLKSLLPFTNTFYKTLIFSDKKYGGVDKWVKDTKRKNKIVKQ